MKKLIGYQKQLNKEDLKIGLKMQEIGIFQEIDIGVRQFQFGNAMNVVKEKFSALFKKLQTQVE